MNELIHWWSGVPDRNARARAGLGAGVLILATLGISACGGAEVDGSETSPIGESRAAADDNGEGGGGRTEAEKECDDEYGDCYIGCSVDYPEADDSRDSLNELYRDGCEDSCDAAHNLCTSFARKIKVIPTPVTPTTPTKSGPTAEPGGPTLAP
jgi:hypothetical protein